MSNRCNGCGGIIGRDCFNPHECEYIAHSIQINTQNSNEFLIKQLQNRCLYLERYLEKCINNGILPPFGNNEPYDLPY